MSIDLNADVGEGFDDDAVMNYVSSVNIACGAHAGNSEVMAATLRKAKAKGLAIGAHPGYADREHFGRRALQLSTPDIMALVGDQVRAMLELAHSEGVAVKHVKPHGALYNQAAVDLRIAEAIAEAVRSCDPMLILVGLAGSRLLEAGRRAGLRVAAEGFLDRAYEADGTLSPRDLENSQLTELSHMAAQALALVRGTPFAARDGVMLTLRVQTLCLHGDRSDVGKIAHYIRAALAANAISCGPLVVELG